MIARIPKVGQIPKNMKSNAAALIRRNTKSGDNLRNQNGTSGAKEAGVKIAKSFAVPVGIGAGVGVGAAAAGAGVSSGIQSMGSGGKKAVFGLAMIAGIALLAVYAVPKIMTAVR